MRPFAWVIGSALLINEGIDIWTDPPPAVKLRFVRTTHERDGKLLVIRLEATHRLTPRTHQPCTIAIDLERSRLSTDFTDDWLFGRQYRGSGDIGVMILTLPLILLMSPALLVTSAVRRKLEERDGVSRYGRAILRALEGQLDRYTQAVLSEALRNSYAHNLARTRRVTLEEAKQLLANCDLTEERTLGQDVSQGFNWYNDEQEQVAVGSFYGTRDHYIQVLGSQFVDAEADALTACHRSHEINEVH